MPAQYLVGRFVEYRSYTPDSMDEFALEEEKQHLVKEPDSILADETRPSLVQEPASCADRQVNDGILLTLAVPPGFPLQEGLEYVAEIGSGGMGAIYKGRDPILRKNVAVKILHPHLVSQKNLRRFQQEAQALSAIDCEQIVKVLKFGFTEQQPYMVMDFVEGEPLDKKLKRRGTLAVEESLPIFIQICDGLAKAHRHNVYHRDLKPSNVIVTSDQHIKIIDFGIAKMLEAEASDIDKLTRTGEVFGSPQYMSPEQVQGEPVDHRSDIYSMGCLMYEVLTGCPPFVGKSPLETLMRHLNDTAPSLAEGSIKQEFPQFLESAVAKCLKKDPKERYQSMAALRADLVERAVSMVPSGKLAPDSVPTRKSSMTLYKSFTTLALVSSVCIFAIFALGRFVGPTYIPKVVSPASETERDLNQSKAHFQAVEDSLKGVRMDRSGKNLTDSSLDTIAQLTGLTVLNLSNNPNLTDAGLVKLKNLKHLEELNLQETGVGSKALIEFAKSFRELKVLNVSRCPNIRPDDFKYIAKFNNLTDLYAFEDQVTDAGLEHIRRLKLRTLRLAHAHVGDAGLAALAGMPLEILRVASNPIHDAGVKKLALLPLQRLCVDHTLISNESVDTLLSMPRLELISVSNTGIDRRGLERLFKSQHFLLIDSQMAH